MLILAISQPVHYSLANHCFVVIFFFLILAILDIVAILGLIVLLFSCF